MDQEAGYTFDNFNIIFNKHILLLGSFSTPNILSPISPKPGMSSNIEFLMVSVKSSKNYDYLRKRRKTYITLCQHLKNI